MQVLRDDLRAFQGESVLTIGKFDGIHLAHQRLIETIKQRASALDVSSGMVTFDPHPAQVLNPHGPPPLLTDTPQKIALLETLGLDLLIFLTFNKTLMQTRAVDFLAYLNAGLRPRELWVGEDFAMGYQREGDVAFIRAWAASRGIEVFTIPAVQVEGEQVSGSRIRDLLAQGKVAAAARLLGRAPAISGIVHQGDQRGRTIGFPTANILPVPGIALAANGVYATHTVLPDGTKIPSVTNVGTRPTFEGQRCQVESYLFDWEGDLYGKSITVEFIQRLRAEQKFAGIEALLAQIRLDAEQARRLLVSKS
ncbi:MAG: bifunctional riboflavin kinase/FAD synthetase [Ardenticatenales bacterium]|nr:bifunctional riboflavin kinase/FAD synthetase [Ardenticatenales bacterium]